MLKQKYFLTGIFILSAERQPIKLAWRKIVWLRKKGSFIINGKASGISLYPFTSDDPPTDVIKEKSEITRTVTASNLIKGKKVNKIYSKRNLKRNGRTSVNIALPIGIGNKPQFFHIFNFIVTAN